MLDQRWCVSNTSAPSIFGDHTSDTTVLWVHSAGTYLASHLWIAAGPVAMLRLGLTPSGLAGGHKPALALERANVHLSVWSRAEGVRL